MGVAFDASHDTVARVRQPCGQLDPSGKTAEELSGLLAEVGLNDPEVVREVLTVYSASRFGREDLSAEGLRLVRKTLRGLRPMPAG